MCAMFMMKKRPDRDERIVTRRVGQKDKSGFSYITCTWTVDFGPQKVKISFSRDNMCVYIDGEPIETQITSVASSSYNLEHAESMLCWGVYILFENFLMLINDDGYDAHIWWEGPYGKFYIFSDVDVQKSCKPMINYLYINDKLVDQKKYKEHKQKEMVPVHPRHAFELYLRECELEQQQTMN